MRVLALLTGLVCLLTPTHLLAQAEGERLFQASGCVGCHSIGGGRLVGPDLKGVLDRRDEQWLVSFVKSPKTMIDSGDATAKALLAEYNNVLMPDASITEEQIRSILDYIKTSSGSADGGAQSQGSAGAVKAEVSSATREFSKEDVAKGQMLFQGITRFANAGPSCTSCHDAQSEAVTGGAVLAKDLTTAFSRLGGEVALTSIIKSAPFPVMKAAYVNNSLSEQEVTHLVAFLKHVDSQATNQRPKAYGMRLFFGGIFGAVVLLGFYSLVWCGRKKKMVNEDIYSRQVKSE
ncbi:MAG: c-type cytochrome [Deltaproteobacteria bacterium]|nr:c-type cytochrome [Deltaproteobacteria bacterium]